MQLAELWIIFKGEGNISQEERDYVPQQSAKHQVGIPEKGMHSSSILLTYRDDRDTRGARTPWPPLRNSPENHSNTKASPSLKPFLKN